MNNRAFVYVTYIATTTDKLWEALTTGDFTQQYFFGRKIESDWREGSPVTYWKPNGQLDVTGRVLTSQPYRLLSYTWEVPGDETPREVSTRVTFELHPMESTVKLTLKHENLLAVDFVEDNDSFYGYNNGWPAIMSNLKSLLETGRTLPPIVAD